MSQVVQGASNPSSYLDSKKISRLAAFCAKFALAVMVLGSAVRATDSGLACPDWPMCFGTPIPHFDTRIFLEWFHRLVAGIFSVAAAYLGFRVLRSKQLRSQLSVMILAAALLLVWQIILGALTVLELLDPHIVSWHLINAVLLYSVLEWISVKSAANQLGKAAAIVNIPKRVHFALTGLTICVFAQIFIGGMVSSNEAGLMCPDFPQCFGSWWPDISWLSSLQMVHRFVAFGIVTLSILTVLFLMKTPLPPKMRKVVSFLPVLIACQIFLGAINVLWHLPEWASVLHLFVALLIYSLLISATAECWLFYGVAFAKKSPATAGWFATQTQTKA